MYAALCISRNSNVNPCDWIASELPHLLDEICAMAVSVQQTHGGGEQREADGGVAGGPGEDVQLSRAEAKQAWLTAGGDTEKAVRQLLRNRQAKVTWISFVKDVSLNSLLSHPGWMGLFNSLVIQQKLDIY